jgi:hypothetical protein
MRAREARGNVEAPRPVTPRALDKLKMTREDGRSSGRKLDAREADEILRASE